MNERIDDENEIELVTANAEGSGGKSGKKKLPKWAKAIIIILAVLLCLAAGAYIFVSCKIDDYLNKINYTHDPYDPFDTAPIHIDTLPPGYYDDKETEAPTEATATPSLPTPTLAPGETAAPTQIPTETPTPTPSPSPIPTSDVDDDAVLLMSDKVYNILIIGSDTRDIKEFRGNSDVMMLVSFNTVTQKIWLTSFHRDSYVHIPGVGYNKMNSAYAYGGAKLLQKTLQEDFLVVAPNYVIIDFTSFVKVVDALGGIEITLTQEEANGSTVPGITAPGTYTLNGTQALNYARERHLSNDDWGRTQRHRNVVSAVIKKLKAQSVTELLNTMDVLLPLITTNIPKSEIKSIVSKAPEYSKYSVSELSIPINKTWHNDYYRRVTHVIVIDSMWKNIVAIRDKVYAGVELG
ncbi:MAG: LCP family protein [Clostridia bacterium]|nr:LCP family protein [Clostridia bacterium]